MTRLVTYNVRDLLDDRAAVAHVLRSCEADVVCLQEAPRRWFDRHRLRRLAGECGLRLVCGHGGTGGTAVLVHPRVGVRSARALALPTRLLVRTRGCALARLEVDGGELVVASVHLPLDAGQRLDHLDRALSALSALSALAAESVGRVGQVVAGDLNEPPDGPCWDLLHRHGFADAGAQRPEPTHPARRPAHRLDAVLTSAGLAVRATGLAGAAQGLAVETLVAASDHLPLVVELELEAEPAER